VPAGWTLCVVIVSGRGAITVIVNVSLSVAPVPSVAWSVVKLQTEASPAWKVAGAPGSITHVPDGGGRVAGGATIDGVQPDSLTVRSASGGRRRRHCGRAR
jgi:hypothetical protein